MKISLLCCTLFILSCSALAWNCSDPLAARVDVGPVNPGGTAGDGDGQYYKGTDAANPNDFYVCEVPKATPSANTANSASNSSANSASNSSSNSSATANQKQKQQQTQSQVATGGNASSISTAAGGNAIATGNGNNSNDSTTNIAAPRIPVATAVAPPILPTVPCFKGYGGGIQTMAVGGSFGGGKVDKECEARELARSFSGPQTTASCKILLNTKQAKDAGVTMEDCMRPVPPQVVAAVPSQAIAAPPVVIVVPAPVVNIASPALPAPPQYRTEITVVAPKPVKKKHMQPACQNGLELRCVAPEHQK